MIKVIRKTRNTPNRIIEIICKFEVVSSQDLIKYITKDKVEDACRLGCPNYQRKWSCPPYSLCFDQIAKEYKNAIIFSFSTDMIDYYDIKNKYLAIKAANITLKTQIEKVARKLEERTNGYALLSGSCRVCSKCMCKIDLPCKNRKKMRYSMEATYLDVSQISNDLLNHKLLWYSNKTLPSYTSTISMVLTNLENDYENISIQIDKAMEEM